MFKASVLLPLAVGIIFLASEVFCVNKAPVWDAVTMNRVRETFSKEIYENTTENKLLGTLKATDPEGKTVTYGVESDNTVNVDEITGEIRLARLLDREKGDQKVDVVFFAYDPRENGSNVRNQIDFPLRLDVQDNNDNAPQFLDLPYSASIKENLPALTTVFRDVNIQDLDDGYNAEVYVTCASYDEQSSLACQKFGVDRFYQPTRGVYNCSIYTKQSLDYEEQSSYIVTIQARDNGSPRLTSSVNIHITVIDVQDSPPEFLNTPINLYTNESVPVNSKIGKIEARDRDQGNPRPLTIRSLPGSPHVGLFRLQPQTMMSQPVYVYDVYTTDILDREVLRGQASFDVMAIELENGVETNVNATATVLVNIFDVNDNRPTFDQDVYYINASESVRATDNTQIPGLTMTVRDRDDASNARFEVSVQSQTFPGAFAVSPNNATSQGPFALAVINADYMDYEVPSYRQQQVVVVAKEIGTSEMFSSSATVFVSLIDVNDNSPTFLERESNVTIQENTVTNLVKVMSATDLDSGMNGDIVYKIDAGNETNTLEYFSIDPNSGVISQLKAVDYEKNREFPLLISATDQGSSRQSAKAVLRVIIQNVNDLKPVFVASSYTTRVSETSTRLQPAITVQATDTEEGSGAITYRIIQGNNLPKGPAFRIDPNDGRLSVTRNVNFEETPNLQGFFTLTIEASDNGSPPMTNTIDVKVSVEDENNYEPRFDKLIYNASVSELAPFDTSVIQVQATDSDKGDNGKLSYSLQGSLGNFQIDPTSGLIQVSRNAELDSSRPLYRLTVVAADSGSPRQLSSSAVVNVNILDKNNKVPRFTEALYTATVSEKEQQHVVIVKVEATDPDQNKSLVYSIEDSTIQAKDPQGAIFNQLNVFNYKALFYIDADDGEIHIQNNLNYEYVAEMDFAVKVEDVYAETAQPIQTATASVNIRVLGSVDATPRFAAPWRPEDPSYFFNIPEETPVNTLITTLVATDPVGQRDIADFREISTGSSRNYFAIDQRTGDLFVNSRLDYESLQTKMLPLEVAAISNDGQKTAIARIMIYIKDINDQSPQFDEKTYSFSVYESRLYPTTVGKVFATDKDSGIFQEISYTLEGQGAQNFLILNDGQIIISQNAQLDREERPRYELTVTATDNPGGSSQRQESAKLYINLLDENDESPQFNRNSYSFLVVDNVNVNYEVGQIEASDKDMGVNSEIFFTMACDDANALNLFSINGFSGLLTVTLPLIGNEKAFRCTVTATDQGTSPRSTTVPVVITVSSGSDNGAPVFLWPPQSYTVENITENSPPGQLVGTLSASSVAGNVVYSFAENAGVGFVLDGNTGEIRTNATLDREQQAEYELLVRADVVGNSTLSSVLLIRVEVQDLNDNMPLFNGPGCDDEITKSPPVRVYPQENSPIGSRVKVLSACDADDTRLTVTNYTFVSVRDNPDLTSLNPSCVSAQENLFRLSKLDNIKVAIEVAKPLDHDVEGRGKMLLCIHAKDGRLMTAGRRKRQTVYDQLNFTVAYIEVNIADINDNGPIFKDKVMQAVILEFPSDKLVKTVSAEDMDSAPFNRVRYSIQTTRFVHADGSAQNITIAFDIDSQTGDVTTKLIRYTQFISGTFHITVRAEDSLNPQFFSTAVLQVSVLQVGQRLKVTWQNSGSQQGNSLLMNNVQTDMQDAVSGKNWRLVVDELRYHTNSRGERDEKRFDACFVVLDSEGRSPTKDEVFQAILSSKSLDNTYDVGYCDVERSTGLGGGSTYWWVLIALAILIFIGTIILIIIVVIMAARLKQKQDNMRTSLIQN